MRFDKMTIEEQKELIEEFIAFTTMSMSMMNTLAGMNTNTRLIVVFLEAQKELFIEKKEVNQR